MVEWWRIVIIIFLVILSGVFSGLTLGLLGLDNNNLEVRALFILDTDNGPF